jgi:hypothetical protein
VREKVRAHVQKVGDNIPLPLLLNLCFWLGWHSGGFSGCSFVWFLGGEASAERSLRGKAQKMRVGAVQWQWQW